MADEIKVLDAYRLGLEDAGYALDGFKIQPFLDEVRCRSEFGAAYGADLKCPETYTICDPTSSDRLPRCSLLCIRLPSNIRRNPPRPRHLLRHASRTDLQI
jgi:hypothetical protein